MARAGLYLLVIGHQPVRPWDLDERPDKLHSEIFLSTWILLTHSRLRDPNPSELVVNIWSVFHRALNSTYGITFRLLILFLQQSLAMPLHGCHHLTWNLLTKFFSLRQSGIINSSPRTFFETKNKPFSDICYDNRTETLTYSESKLACGLSFFWAACSSWLIWARSFLCCELVFY